MRVMSMGGIERVVVIRIIERESSMRTISASAWADLAVTTRRGVVFRTMLMKLGTFTSHIFGVHLTYILLVSWNVVTQVAMLLPLRVPFAI